MIKDLCGDIVLGKSYVIIIIKVECSKPYLIRVLRTFVCFHQFHLVYSCEILFEKQYSFGFD